MASQTVHTAHPEPRDCGGNRAKGLGFNFGDLTEFFINVSPTEEEGLDATNHPSLSGPNSRNTGTRSLS